MTQLDAQDLRIEAINGDDDEMSFDDCVDIFYSHLKASFQLPCDLTGIE